MTDLFSLPPGEAEKIVRAELERQMEPVAASVERHFLGINDPPRARATDPETSKQAARRAAVRIQMSHANLILGVLWRPMIPPEISTRTGLSIVQIDRRRKELLERNEIRLTGVEREGYQEWERCD